VRTIDAVNLVVINLLILFRCCFMLVTVDRVDERFMSKINDLGCPYDFFVNNTHKLTNDFKSLSCLEYRSGLALFPIVSQKQLVCDRDFM